VQGVVFLQLFQASRVQQAVGWVDLGEIHHEHFAEEPPMGFASLKPSYARRYVTLGAH
jgi:hypothetical protein